MKIKAWMAASGLAICILAQPAAAGKYEDAEAAYKQGDYATAIRLFQPLAEQGNADAQSQLGIMYLIGDGVPQDYSKALKWLTPAAEHGDTNAQTNLGLMYLTGLGVPEDYAEALKLLRPAAEHGDELAQAGLGRMYKNGLGVPQDYAEALRLLRPAAERGNELAQAGLGDMYENGQGVGQDYVQAHMWFNLAATQIPASDTANRNATNSNCDRVAKHMTPDQIAEAQRLARGWLAAHPNGQRPVRRIANTTEQLRIGLSVGDAFRVL